MSALSRGFLLPLAGLACPALAQSQYTTSIVYSNEAGHPTNTVPGTGLPFNLGGGSNSAFNRPWVSANGQHWGLIVALESPSLQNDEALLVDGQLLLREGQPAPWNSLEVVGQMFFSEIGINDAGDVVFENATGTPSAPAPVTTNDYVLLHQNGQWTILAQEAQPVHPVAPGLVGDGSLLATWDDNLDGNRLTNLGVPMWRADGIDGLSTGALNDAIVTLGNGQWLQKGATIPAGQAGAATETWEVFDARAVYTSPDGALWMVQGDLTGATTGDDVVVLGGTVVVQEGVPLGPFTSPVDAGGPTKSWIDRGGNWYVRGDNVDQTDWVLRNGVVVATSVGTDPIVPGSSECWDDAIYTPGFFGFDGNAIGQFLIAGVTNHPNVNTNGVLVFDDGLGNRHVVVREGDPVDVDGNGLFDDDRFYATFGDDDMALLNDGTVLFLATLRDGAGTSVSHGFFRLAPRSASCTFRNGNGINPPLCTCNTLPVLGTNWSIGTTPNANTVLTFVQAAFAPQPAPLPMFGGEILVDTNSVGIPGFGTHAFVVPTAPLWMGLPIYVQGFRLDLVGSNFQIVILNGQDGVLGM